MTDRDQPWSQRIALGDVPDEGLHVAMEADAETRAKIARTAGLRDLPQLGASFDVRRKGVGLHIEGEVIATLGQNCVITLEPIEKNLHEVVDLVFAPNPAESLGDAEGEASFGMTDAEPSEPLVGGVVDLGAIATEYFLLGIDPYPRKEGAVFEAAPYQEPVESPFAALASLKKPPQGRK
jgi:uncharacterized metal-binding protein YceD (DUF177 family)